MMRVSVFVLVFSIGCLLELVSTEDCERVQECAKSLDIGGHINEFDRLSQEAQLELCTTVRSGLQCYEDATCDKYKESYTKLTTLGKRFYKINCQNMVISNEHAIKSTTKESSKVAYISTGEPIPVHTLGSLTVDAPPTCAKRQHSLVHSQCDRHLGRMKEVTEMSLPGKDVIGPACCEFKQYEACYISNMIIHCPNHSHSELLPDPQPTVKKICGPYSESACRKERLLDPLETQDEGRSATAMTSSSNGQLPFTLLAVLASLLALILPLRY